MIRRTVGVCLLAWTLCSTVGVDHEQAGTTRQLIDQLSSKREEEVMAAAQVLAKQGAQVVPALLEAFDNRKDCQTQFVASGILRMIEPKHERIEPVLAAMVRRECVARSAQDLDLGQQAAFVLSHTVSGLALLTEMVNHKDLQTRRRVAFAFEDLTEKLEVTAEELRASTDLVEPTARPGASEARSISQRARRNPPLRNVRNHGASERFAARRNRRSGQGRVGQA